MHRQVKNFLTFLTLLENTKSKDIGILEFGNAFDVIILVIALCIELKCYEFKFKINRPK